MWVIVFVCVFAGGELMLDVEGISGPGGGIKEERVKRTLMAMEPMNAS